MALTRRSCWGVLLPQPVADWLGKCTPLERQAFALPVALARLNLPAQGAALYHTGEHSPRHRWQAAAGTVCLGPGRWLVGYPTKQYLAGSTAPCRHYEWLEEATA